MNDELMSTREVAERLHVPEETVRYWRHSGKGPSGFKIGRHVLYERAEVERFLADAKSREH